MILKQRGIIRELLLSASLFSIFYLLFFTGCSADKQDKVDFDRETVAIVNDDTITIYQFKRSYESAMRYTSDVDNSENRRLHLQKMIDGYLLANAARGKKLDTLQAFQNYQEIAEREAMREYQYLEIRSTIRLNDDQVHEAFRRSQESRLVRHLYSRDQKQINEWHRLIIDGKETFSSLSKIAFRDSILQRNGGLLGWIIWGDLDLKFEDVIYNISKGEISKPFKSNYGWHILKVEEIRRNLLPTKLDFERFKVKNEKKVRRILQEDTLSSYLNDFMKEQQLTLNVPLMRTIAAEIKQQYQDYINFENIKLRRLPSESVESLQLRLYDMLDEIIVESKDHKWAVRDFIKRIPELPINFVLQEFDKAIAFAVRNDLLARDAYLEGLNRKPEVKEAVFLRSQDWLARLENQIMLDDIQPEKRPNFTDEDVELFRLQEWRKTKTQFLKQKRSQTPIQLFYFRLDSIYH